MQSSKVMNTNKKHSRTSPDVQFKEFSLTKQKLDHERTMSELRKPFPKKSDQKNFKKTENQCQNAACEKKPLARRRNFLFKHRFLTLL